MTVPPGLIYLPPAGLAVAALLRGRAMRRASGLQTLAEILAPLLMGVLAYAYLETLVLNTRWGWSACRLAPTIGLFHGYPLYSPVDHGPINGWMYGPVAALAWTPAALAGSPLPALATAASINLVFLLAPLLAAGVTFTRDAGSPRLLAFAFGAAAILQVYATWYMASALCVDAVAVGLGAGSCLVLLGDTAPGTRRLLAAASLAALAAWAKQIEAPLVLAQAAWLGWRLGPRVALKYAALVAAAAAAVGAGVAGAMQPRDVLFDMWTVPAHQALLGGWPAAWGEVTAFARYTAIFSVPCAALLLFPRERPPEGGPACSAASALALLIAAAVALLPAGVMATIKVAGDRNSVHSTYYLALAATIALARGWSPAHAGIRIRRAAVLAAASATVLLAARQVAAYPGMTMLPPRCLSEAAWRFARAHPGEAYFPWDPLATLMAEGRAYNFEDGVLNRAMAGVPADESRVRESMPAHPPSIIYPRANGSRTMLRLYYPDYAFSLATEDWLVYRRPDGRPTARP